jgi:hypothetical protein
LYHSQFEEAVSLEFRLAESFSNGAALCAIAMTHASIYFHGLYNASVGWARWAIKNGMRAAAIMPPAPRGS